MTMLLKYSYFLWLVIIILLNTLPVNETGFSEYTTSRTRGFRIDYLIHFAGFFILPLFYYLSLIYGKLNHSLGKFFLILVVSISAAVLIELAQIFIPYRSYNPNDIYYNTSGVVAGFIIFYPFIIKHITRRVTG
jgi:VanZ family protein